MFKHTRTALKFFVYGLLVGVFFAPRNGDESRKRFISWITGTAKEAVGSVTGSSGS